MALWTWTSFICILYLNVELLAYNLDPRIPVVKVGDPGTYFGYSVAEHIIIPSRGRADSRLLVGAPRAQGNQPGTNASGAIFSCPLSSNRNDCSMLNIDDEEHAVDDDEIKDDQWLGVVVRSQGPGKYVMACAHRYVKKTKSARWGLGICYSLSQHLDKDSHFEPCQNRPTQKAHEQFGYCQAGTSGTITEDNVILIGAPGPYTWRGVLFTNSITQEMRDDTQWYLSPYLDEGAPVDKYSYLGMAVTAGKFFNNTMCYVGGAPRANNTGQVVIFTKISGQTILQVQTILSGEVFASSFGYEVQAADLNGDKLPDLIVGAPFYYGKDAGGAIYIYMNSPKGIRENAVPIRITGKEESRFGFAIANCSDLNKDGYEDIAVGAPYEGNGVVYIFLGSKDGIIKEPIQVIKAEDLPISVRTFGYSLSGGLDLDNNGYPDLLVGAYEDSKVILLRARPIIGIITEVQDEVAVIDPASHRTCDDEPQKNCFTFKTCFEITSTHSIARSGLLVNYTVEAELFTGKMLSRVFFKDANSLDNRHIVQRTIRTSKQKHCQKEKVYLKDNPQDILTPIKFKLTLSLLQEKPTMNTENQPLPNINLYPILNQQEASKIFQASFEKDCGDDDVCESDLHSESRLLILPLNKTSAEHNYTEAELIMSDGELVLGEVKEIVLEVSVINRNESAYEAAIYVTHPASIRLIGTFTANSTISLITCNPHNDTLVICSLGNPFKRLPAPSVVLLRFNPSDVDDTETSLHFSVKVNSTSRERTPEPDLHVATRVVRRAELEITGVSQPEQVFYGGEVRGESAMKYEDHVGYLLHHNYGVTNHGPWKVGLTKVTVSWPYEVENKKPHGKWLLYLIETPRIDGGEECLIDPKYVNPLNLKENPHLKLTALSQSTQKSSGNFLTVPEELAIDKTTKGFIEASTRSQVASETSEYEYSEGERSRVTEERRTSKTETKITRTRTRTFHSETTETRSKRSVVILPEEIRTDGQTYKVVTMDCEKGTAKCFQFVCFIRNLKDDQTAYIRIRARLWNSTFVEDYPNVDWVNIISRASLKIESTLDIKQNLDNDQTFVETRAYPDIPYSQRPPEVPIWIYIVAACAGILLLIILILCLWKLGFFKRRKPDMSMKGSVEKHNDINSHDY